MDDFTKYNAMKESGASPAEVYRVAKADGLDEITLLRLLRKVFGMSLAQAKEASGAGDALAAEQDVKPGTLVYWEGWGTDEGLFLMQARVVRLEGDMAVLAEHKKYRVTGAGLEEVPVLGQPLAALKVSYLKRPLSERMGELLTFVEQLAALDTRAGAPVGKRAV
jgi:hypothetical protein